MAETQTAVKKPAAQSSGLSALPAEMRASEEEVENIEKSYWKRTLHDMAKDWRLYVMLLPLVFFDSLKSLVVIGCFVKTDDSLFC
jgi:hypothetical protein